MKSWFYYNRLAFLDLVRLWSSTQHHVIIVAGICLPILLLLGLKRGHVAELRHELLTSPTGRQVVFWSAQQGELLNASRLKQLEIELPGVELIIPETQRVVQLSRLGADGDNLEPVNTTLYSTRPGDPLLAQVQGDVLLTGELAVVLGRPVAKKLGVRAGHTVLVSVRRQLDAAEETASVTLTVKAVIGSAQEKGDIAFADERLLSSFEQYVRGYRVNELNWPAMRVPVRDRYSAYLLCCETGAQLSDDDVAVLKERGLMVASADASDLRPFYGLMKAGSDIRMRLYKISTASSESDPRRRMAFAPSEISELTSVDDVVIPWNTPRSSRVQDTDVLLVGLSLPKRTWLREYLAEPDSAFEYEDMANQARVIAGREELVGNISLTLRDASILQLISANGSPDVKALEDALERTPTAEEFHDVEPRNDSLAPSAGTDSQTSAKEGSAQVPIQHVNTHSGPNASNSPTESASDSARVETVVPPGGLSGTTQSESGISSRTDDVSPEDSAGNNSSGLAISEPHPVGPVKQPDFASTTVVLVPANLLAYLDAYDHQLAMFDPATQMFVAVPEPSTYDKARLYADTIDTVPAIVDNLIQRGFAVMSEGGRISEIHQQDASLELLVYVVGAGVFVFGVITVVSVLLDSTDRKRGTLGILRVMGVSRIGVFYLVTLWAAVIGILAGVLSLICGYGIALLFSWSSGVPAWLAWKPTVAISIAPLDVVVVFAGAMVCAGIGALLPAWKASRLDPFDAIVEGRFR